MNPRKSSHIPQNGPIAYHLAVFTGKPSLSSSRAIRAIVDAGLDKRISDLERHIKEGEA
jgi:hypothetical protein